MSTLGEFELIERYFGSRSRRRHVEVGIGDDAAVVRGSGRFVVAVDTLVAGVHFPEDLPAHAIGYRALAVNVSDLAAMGVGPDWFTLALTLPDVDEDWLQGFADGLDVLAARYDIALVGGDTTRGPLTVTVQVMADAGDLPVLLRSGASPGDAIYVTGTLGDAAAVVDATHSRPPATLARRFDYPEPRVAAGRALRSLARAAIDISDGLLADLGHICESSGCGASLDVGALPLSADLLGFAGLEKARSYALSGGDDYELCVVVPAGQEAALAGIAAATNTPLTRIGACRSGGGIDLALEGSPYAHAAAGYRHF